MDSSISRLSPASSSFTSLDDILNKMEDTHPSLEEIFKKSLQDIANCQEPPIQPFKRRQKATGLNLQSSIKPCSLKLPSVLQSSKIEKTDFTWIYYHSNGALSLFQTFAKSAIRSCAIFEKVISGQPNKCYHFLNASHGPFFDMKAIDHVLSFMHAFSQNFDPSLEYKPLTDWHPLEAEAILKDVIHLYQRFEVDSRLEAECAAHIQRQVAIDFKYLPLYLSWVFHPHQEFNLIRQSLLSCLPKGYNLDQFQFLQEIFQDTEVLEALIEKAKERQDIFILKVLSHFFHEIEMLLPKFVDQAPDKIPHICRIWLKLIHSLGSHYYLPHLSFNLEPLTPPSIAKNEYVLIFSAIYHLNRITEDTHQKGLTLLKQAKKINPRQPMGVVLEALWHHKIGNNSKALLTLNTYLQKSQDAFMLTTRAQIQLAMKLDGQALDSVAQALKVQKNNPCALTLQGYLKLMIAKDQAGLEDLAQAIKLDPLQGFIFRYRGNSYSMKNQFELALMDFQESLMFDPFNLEALTSISWIYLNQRKMDLALKSIRACLKIDPQNAKSLSHYGLWHTLKKDFESALIFHEQAIKLEPENVEILNARAKTYIEMKEFEKARQDFRRAFDMNPSSTKSILNLASIHRLTERPDLALYYDILAVSIDPKRPDVYLSRAKSLMMQEKMDIALTDLNIAHDLNPLDSTILTLRGQCYYSKGQIEEARKDYEAALKCNPGDTLALKFLDNLNSSKKG